MDKIIETEAGYVDWDLYSDPIFDDEGNEASGPEYMKVDNLFVKPEYRGQGHARQLLTDAIKAIRESGYAGSIKIVPEPKDASTSFDQLSHFYDSFSDLEVVAY